MALFFLSGAPADAIFDELLLWLVALLASSIGVVSLVNVFDMLFETDAG